MYDDLFTYEVEVANIPCNTNMDDDLKHEADNDMGYDSSDVAFTEWWQYEVAAAGQSEHDTCPKRVIRGCQACVSPRSSVKRKIDNDGWENLKSGKTLKCW
ncbi:hypothetical protein Tco_0803321 [Tanacetum coccineum]|uniref:Uncharacterized protein n=1 Tax=Tanacetum coccineum TaxID=301880 RepID=A0ABQ5A5M1_9ASTR